MIVGAVPKEPSEQFTISVDFSAELAVGETVISAVVTSRNAATGADSSSTILNGSATITTPKVLQSVRAGADGERHIVTILATTSASPANKWEAEVSISVEED